MPETCSVIAHIHIFSVQFVTLFSNAREEKHSTTKALTQSSHLHMTRMEDQNLNFAIWIHQMINKVKQMCARAMRVQTFMMTLLRRYVIFFLSFLLRGISFS